MTSGERLQAAGCIKEAAKLRSMLRLGKLSKDSLARVMGLERGTKEFSSAWGNLAPSNMKNMQEVVRNGYFSVPQAARNQSVDTRTDMARVVLAPFRPIPVKADYNRQIVEAGAGSYKPDLNSAVSNLLVGKSGWSRFPKRLFGNNPNNPRFAVSSSPPFGGFPGEAGVHIPFTKSLPPGRPDLVDSALAVGKHELGHLWALRNPAMADIATKGYSRVFGKPGQYREGGTFLGELISKAPEIPAQFRATLRPDVNRAARASIELPRKSVDPRLWEQWRAQIRATYPKASEGFVDRMAATRAHMQTNYREIDPRTPKPSIGGWLHKRFG